LVSFCSSAFCAVVYGLFQILGRRPHPLAPAIELRSVAELRPGARNPRTHSKKQIRQIAASIRQFGFVNPVLVDAAGGVVAGHGRLEAAKLLGLTAMPPMSGRTTA